MRLAEVLKVKSGAPNPLLLGRRPGPEFSEILSAAF